MAQECIGLALSVGVDGLHCISGTCDLCGEACDANTQELNVLSCTFKNCEDLPYHQDCLEKVTPTRTCSNNFQVDCSSACILTGHSVALVL